MFSRQNDDASRAHYLILGKSRPRLKFKAFRFFSILLVSLNNETAAMLVFETNPVGVELFSCVNAFFFAINLHDAGHVSEDALYVAIDEKGEGSGGCISYFMTSNALTGGLLIKRISEFLTI